MLPIARRLLVLGCLALTGAAPAHAAAPFAPGGARVDAYGDSLPAEALARLGTGRFRVLRWANADNATLSRDGKTLAVVTQWRSRKSLLTLIDAATGKKRARFEIDGFQFDLPTFAGNGKELVVVSSDGSYRFLDVGTGKLLRKTEEHLASSRPPVVSDDGKVLACLGRSKGTILVFGPDGKKRASLNPLYDGQMYLAMSANGKVLASHGALMQSVQVWDAATGKEVRKVLAGDRHLVSAAALSPDGKRLAVMAVQLGAGKERAWRERRSWLQIWDLASGKRLRAVPARHDADSYLTFSPAGKVVVAAGVNQDAGVQAWVADNGRPLPVAAMPPCRFRSVAFSPDGSMIGHGVNGHSVVLWNLRSGKLLSPAGGHQHPVAAVCFSRGGKRVLSVGLGGTLLEWSLQGAELRRLPVLPGSLSTEPSHVRRLAFSNAGAYLSLAAHSGDAHVCDVNTGKPLLSCANYHAGYSEPAFSPDGELLAAGGTSGGGKSFEVKLWKVSTGKEVAVLKVGTNLLVGMAVGPGGSSVAVGQKTKRRPNARQQIEVGLWQKDTGRESSVFKSFRLRAWSGSMALSFSPDGRFLVTADPLGTVYVLDATTGAEIWQLAMRWKPSAALVFSPDGRSLAVATSRALPGYADQQATVTLWELSSGQKRWESESVDARITALAFAPDSQTLAVGHADGTVLLWDVAGRLRGGKPLAPADLEQRWAELGSPDAQEAFAALRVLASAPKQAVALVRKRVPPATGKSLPPAVVARLLGELDSENFTVRARAEKALAEEGSAVEEVLRKAIVDKPPLERRLRLQRLLARLDKRAVPPELRRPLRAVELLEWAGTAEARQALGRLAKGHPGSALTRQAQQALNRLAAAGR